MTLLFAARPRSTHPTSASMRSPAAFVHAGRAVALACALASAIAIAGCGSSGDKPAVTIDSATAATADSTTTIGAGEAMLAVRGGRIWYKRSGAGSSYLQAVRSVGRRPADRSVRSVGRRQVRSADGYDPDGDSALRRGARSLRRALKIDRWILNGHSWGTVLALEYYKAHPQHVAAIVFGSSVFDWPAYARETDTWTKQLSDSAQTAIARWKQTGDDTPSAFKAATDEFYGKYVFRRPMKADLDSTFASYVTPQYVYMQGAYEYVVTGTLKNYGQTAVLPSIKVPVLVTTAEFGIGISIWVG